MRGHHDRIPDVFFDRREAVGWIVMDRPSGHNALTVVMARSLADAVAELAGDPSVRAIVLTANGPSFNAWTDLDELAGDATDERRVGAEALVDLTTPTAAGLAAVGADEEPAFDGT